MRIDIMTLFPDTVGDMMNESILGRAQERDIIRIEAHQIRDYTANRQNQVDDYPYGGGHGAILQADPLYQCWKHICEEAGERVHTIYLSPAGRTFRQGDARRLKDSYQRLILVCGHYEGIDERFLNRYVDEVISLGDFVLSGGELAAAALMDAVVRQLPGAIKDLSSLDESFATGLLDAPHYTRPEVWRGEGVPEVLLSGHHANIARWSREESLRFTLQTRPDLIKIANSSGLLSKADKAYLRRLDPKIVLS